MNMNNIPRIDKWKDTVFEEAGIEVGILRLDLIHATVSGNKWLKLKNYLQIITNKKKSGILTKGGPWSNHVHACTYICKNFNLNCYLWIKSNEKKITATLEDCINWNAHIEFVNRTTFYDEELSKKFAEENNLLYIPMGGSDDIGMNSVTAYIDQLSLPFYTHAVCAVGTATTFGGLAFSEKYFSHIIGIESGTGDKQLNQKINGWQLKLPDKRLELLTQYSFGGLPKYDASLIHFMNNLHQQHGFSTDFIYTAKLFYAVKDLAQQSSFPAQSKLLIIHSGGLQGNRSLYPTLLQF